MFCTFLVIIISSLIKFSCNLSAQTRSNSLTCSYVIHLSQVVVCCHCLLLYFVCLAIIQLNRIAILIIMLILSRFGIYFIIHNKKTL